MVEGGMWEVPIGGLGRIYRPIGGGYQHVRVIMTLVYLTRLASRTSQMTLASLKL